MSLLNAVIDNYLQSENASKHTLETLTIKESIEIAEDEVVIVHTCQSVGYSYYSADEAYSDSEEIAHRLTVNKSFLEILTGTPQLQAVRIKITDYQTEPQHTPCAAIAIAVSQ